MNRSDWRVRHHVGSAGEHHARLPEPRHEVWVHRITAPALVLGSTQSEALVDRVACERRGVAIVRRRSGGGAVLLEPDSVWWVDVVVPTTDERLVDDVGASFHWLGRAWAEVVAAHSTGEVLVHEGGADRSPEARLACFAGLGPGEVTVDGAKVVGLSQRRTRDLARFQGLVLRSWDPGRLLELLAVPDEVDRPALEARLRTVGRVDVDEPTWLAQLLAVL